MKIRIEFTNNEKEAFANVTELPLKHDYKTTEEGKYGSFIYDPNGFMEVNLKDEFMEDIIDLTEDILDTAKAILKMFSRFTKRWTKDIVVKQFDEEGDEIIRCADDDGNIVYRKVSGLKDVKDTEDTEEEAKVSE